MAKCEAKSSAKIKKKKRNEKKVKFIFIELNSLQIGFATHHQLKSRLGQQESALYAWRINAFEVDYKVW